MITQVNRSYMVLFTSSEADPTKKIISLLNDNSITDMVVKQGPIGEFDRLLSQYMQEKTDIIKRASMQESQGVDDDDDDSDDDDDDDEETHHLRRLARNTKPAPSFSRKYIPGRTTWDAGLEILQQMGGSMHQNSLGAELHSRFGYAESSKGSVIDILRKKGLATCDKKRKVVSLTPEGAKFVIGAAEKTEAASPKT